MTQVSIGDLRYRVTIQRPIAGSDGQGGHPKSWADVATVWAAIDSLSGREYFYAQQIRAEATHRVTIRARDDVAENMRVIWEDTALRIESVIDKTATLQELMCIEVKTNED